ncbi:KilA-N domain-containing protein [Microbulbifer sp. 2304DJ12-6]|uniref:KilA-N domain-containing protein n=1 Tax=Microbulbifer sp. 2304DJ12-6 TaxID=3233340 RepID=UPI0039AF4C5E
MSHVKQLPVIAGVEITTDMEGRFNLNALHTASGGEKRNGPTYWLTLESTQQLIEEIKKQNTGIPVFTAKGRSGGSFAVEQLAVAYANWISPAFYLQVIDTFLDYKKGKFLNHPGFLGGKLS